ncbi:MAG TPA: phosphatidate cytidylyltransferase [Anaerolineales bacterium]|nr:phosphatidate cytidylyltransferase [Anaerolineales bacterium]
MTAAHWNVLLIYFGFTLVATLLALARRWLRPNAGGESVWRKYPVYILINLFFLAASWLPPESHALTILLAVLGALASWEIARALIQSARLFLFPAVTLVLVVVADFLSMTDWFKIWLATLLVAVAAATLTTKPDNYSRPALALAGCLIYLPLCLAPYLWIQQGDPSGFRSVFLYLIVATNDALAQITGQLLGRRQLSPHVSPAKTVEGAAGGLLFASAMGLALGRSIGFDFLTVAMFGALLGMAGLVGDLTASMWKRALGIRNYSALLGAQGGVLDRFDGLIFAAPIFYLLLVIAA